ncbi:signal transduction histidine kinase [Pseudorhizobium tarimense]|uniref:Signal transduction histidine kinase n=1 Tax=Pseudorhizobium tarimense TaxID=1079109 RepID=A0ABV2H1N5_9HYPH|nr:hypothetical protein [Pseudorhizobium tarimense]MCJ8517937.1 hypothetical protein [Pseudorhizobium tarimense]
MMLLRLRRPRLPRQVTAANRSIAQQEPSARRRAAPCLSRPRLENAILDGAVNARDAMPGGGHLTIETANAQIYDAYAIDHGIGAGQYVMVAVTDTGTGMAPDVIDCAFDRSSPPRPSARAPALA